MKIEDIPAFVPSNDDLPEPAKQADSVSADAPPSPTLALALHDMAHVADDEARRYRTARNIEVAYLHGQGVPVGLLAETLGVGRRAVYNMIDDAKVEQ